MEKGVHAGYPVVDVRVTLLDGKAHSVDSSDFAFQMAGALALREAAAATKVMLLEPIDEISVLVPDDFVGAVMGDLSGRRGRVLGTDTAGHERTVVKAEVPQVELTRYAIDLRSLAHGAASFTRSFARYEPMPESAAAQVKTCREINDHVDSQRTSRPYPAQPFRRRPGSADAILAILCALWPAARRRLIWLVLLLAVGTLVVTPLTTSSGGGCRTVGASPGRRPRATRRTLIYIVAALVATSLLAVVHFARRAGDVNPLHAVVGCW